jgi:target of rapamycin complex subunit LST8
MTSPTAIFSLEGITKNTTSIGFQDKGNWMFTGGEDKIIRLWDMR